jgi:predicted S18 family serine protease
MSDLLSRFTSEIISDLCQTTLTSEFLKEVFTIIQNKSFDYSKEIGAYKVTFFGTSYTTDNLEDLIKHLKDNFDDNTLSPKIETIIMTKAEYKSLPEFQGY